MVRSHLSWLRIIPVVVFLMSGLLSIFRELLLIYRPQTQPRTLFWHCTIVAFILSAGIVWWNEHKMRIAAEKVADTRSLKDLLGKALIEGERLLGLPDDEKQTIEWESYVSKLVRDSLGDGEAGLLTVNTGYTFYVSQKTTPLHTRIEGRVLRLTDLIRRL
jgi:hypothetical protein